MYCVYRTTYLGKLMPKYYIGSTSIKKIVKGYHGSVMSKKYKDIWKKELKNNSNLFSTEILSEHNTKEAALQQERAVQVEYNVVKSPDFINMGLAITGYKGCGKEGENNPMYGKHHSKESRKKISEHHKDVSGKNNPSYGRPGSKHMLGKHHSIETKKKMSDNHWDCSGKNNPGYGIKGEKHPWFGCKHSKKTKEKMRIPKQIIQCPHCGKIGGKPPMIRFHFDNCKIKVNN